MESAPVTGHTAGELDVSRLADDTLLVRLKGSWCIQDGLPSGSQIQQQVEADTQIRRLCFEAGGVTAWDSGLLTFLRNLQTQFAERQLTIDREGLPEGVKKLLALAEAVPERQGARRTATRTPWLAHRGQGRQGTGE